MTMIEIIAATAGDGLESQPVRASSEHMQPCALQSRNVRIHSRRTSVRLEPEMWSALNEIAKLENCSIHDLCGAVHDLKDGATSFTGALRVFLMEYYRAQARASTQVTQVQKRLKNRDKPLEKTDVKVAVEG